MTSLDGSLIAKFSSKQANSFYLESKNIKLSDDLHELRYSLKTIASQFIVFRQDILKELNKQAQEVSLFLFMQTKQRDLMESQLQKSKMLQSNMKKQVIQLKEMIGQAISDYTKQLEKKDQQIQHLKAIIRQKEQKQVNEQNNVQLSQLTIIQEQSQHATFSSVNSCRDSKQINISRIIPATVSPQQHVQEQREQKQNRQHRKTKSFIDNFRKTIEESFKNQTNLIQLNNGKQNKQTSSMPLKQANNYVFEKKCFAKDKGQLKIRKRNDEPLKDISNQFNNQYPSFFNETNSKPASFVLHSKPIIENPSQKISSSSSLNELITCSELQHINTIKVFEPAFNLKIFKRKDNRVNTEPSPERYTGESSNSQVCKRGTSPRNRIFGQRKQSAERKPSNQRSNSQQQGRSIKSSSSKQKIRVTSKMIEENHLLKRNSSGGKNIAASKNLVYLGGKSLFRKFLSELKVAIKKYVIWGGHRSEEIRYEGERRNGQRWGKGRIYYRSGMMYEGEFKGDLRHGRGVLLTNGVSLYDGEWVDDRVHGEGYLKSLKMMSNNCPSVLAQASYCGNLKDGQFNGIGTLFLNSKEKIVTKFNLGGPMGELTYYNVNDIDFAVWPTD